MTEWNERAFSENLGWGVWIRILRQGDGQITYEDFIEGILRCKGPARAMDQSLCHCIWSCQHAIVLRDVPLLSVPSHVYCMYLQSERGRETHGDAKTEIHTQITDTQRG